MSEGWAKQTLAAIARTRSAAAVVTTGGRALGRVDPGPESLTVLTYHRVAPRENGLLLAPSLATVTPEGFDGHLRAISKIGTVVDLSTVADAFAGVRPLPPRAVLITLDDGYRDIARHAWPLLREHGLPAAVFVATAFPDTERTFWWDDVWAAVTTAEASDLEQIARDRGVAIDVGADPHTTFRVLRDHIWTLSADDADEFVTQLRDIGSTPAASDVLSWREIDDLHDQGLAVAAHTRTHQLLTKLTTELARAEIQDSIEDLRERGYPQADVFAYPGGDVDDRTRAAAAAAGCSLAFTTVRGCNRMGAADPLRMRRINVGHSTAPAVLAVQLVPSLARIDRWGGR